MAIKTLAELNTEAKAAYAVYKQERAAAAAQLESVKAAQEKADRDRKAALISGDSQAYAAAQQAYDFNRAKYDQLFNLNAQPLYTEDVYMAYRRQIDLARGTELKPLYEQLKEAFATCKAIIPQIKALLDLNNGAAGNFKATIPGNAKYGPDDVYFTNLIFGFAESVYGDIGDVFRDNSKVDQNINDAVTHCENLIRVNTQE